MLERQHKSIKDSLKAAIVDMGEQYQNRWLDYLPFILLGKNVALQPDIGASPSELCFGTNLRVPGQILRNPGEVEGPELQDILRKVRLNNAKESPQPSNHSQPETPLNDIPDGVTHVYTRQHKNIGLQTPFEGPLSW